MPFDENDRFAYAPPRDRQKTVVPPRYLWPFGNLELRGKAGHEELGKEGRGAVQGINSVQVEPAWMPQDDFGALSH